MIVHANRWRCDGSTGNWHDTEHSCGREAELGRCHARGRRSANNHDRRFGHGAINGDVARTPAVVASLGLATTGVGINGETHQVLFTNPNAGNLTSFSLLNNTVNSITFMNGGVAVDQLGFSAAAASPLENVGIAVNALSATAAIVDLENGNVLQTVTLPGSGFAAGGCGRSGEQYCSRCESGKQHAFLSYRSAMRSIRCKSCSPARR